MRGYRTLRNTGVDHFRQTAVRPKAAEQITDECKEGHDLELKAKACVCICETVHELKSSYHAVIERVDLSGESVGPFTKAEGTTANNAYLRVHRARKAPAKKLMEMCGACVTHRYIDCTCNHDSPVAKRAQTCSK